jgi:hypothetical protein
MIRKRYCFPSMSKADGAHAIAADLAALVAIADGLLPGPDQ